MLEVIAVGECKRNRMRLDITLITGSTIASRARPSLPNKTSLEVRTL